MIDLAAIERLTLDDTFKGFPGGAGPMRLGEVGAQGWSLLAEDLPLPACVLKSSALAHNERWMESFLAGRGAAIAPHGKTTMSPQLFARQLERGAWAITVANVAQLQVCRRFGPARVVLANQLVGRRAIGYVLDEMAHDPDFELYSLVDSEAGVKALARAAAERAPGRPLPLWLEVGVAGGRTGCRDLDTALAVARAVRAAAPRLALRGVEGFEGLIAGTDPADQEARVRAFLDFLAAAAEVCDREDLFAPGTVSLSAGGSAFYDLVTERLGRVRLSRPTRVLTRSGCYLTHDSEMYRRHFERLRERTPRAATLGEGPRAALEVWAYVQSVPEPGLAILNAGRRDLSSDAGLPVPLARFRPGTDPAPRAADGGWRITDLNDQHAYLAAPPAAGLAVGDMVALGISHPCTTFDKWRLIYVVDDDYRVVSAIRTFF